MFKEKLAKNLKQRLFEQINKTDLKIELLYYYPINILAQKHNVKLVVCEHTFLDVLVLLNYQHKWAGRHEEMNRGKDLK